MSERIEKILARELNEPRSRVKTLLQKGQVTVDGVVARAGQQADPDTQEICLAGEPIACRAFVYLMLNKPTGVLSATDGKGEPTVLDLVPSALRRKALFPAGRLDKDTTGFVLLTDDGAFAHRILSPRSHIPKTYIATLDKPVLPTAAAAFAGGMEMDGKVLQPAQLTILSAHPPRVQVVLRQGIYHQVKRMFARVLPLFLILDGTRHVSDQGNLTSNQVTLRACQHQMSQLIHAALPVTVENTSQRRT